MSIRTALIMLTLAAASGCASTTEPMACDGNPKCKADTQPIVPTKLKLASASVDSSTIRHAAR
jgi:hypothetical protein